MHYALIIPALNEEKAIAATLRRALEARQKVLAKTPVTKMTIVFVNDGSTDDTQKIVDQPEFDEVVKIRFPQNKGYGAAIMAGWQAVEADLLGFIDADGTCDPDYSVQLINRLVDTNADVVLAGRMNPQSKMPRIRKLGNLLFANLLNVVSHSKITDCASGFRVVRRASLRHLSPLPKGLHFTPAMSAICLLDPRLRIEEVPMPYEERIGRSKLSVLKDGFRFLYVILFTICCYTPIRTMFTIAGLWSLLVAALAVGASMIGQSAAVPMLALAGGIVAGLCAWSGIICHQLNYLLIGPRRRVGWAERALQKYTEYKLLIVTGALLLVLGIGALLSFGAASPVTAVLAGWIVVGGALTALAGVILRVIWAVSEKQTALINEGPWGNGLSAASLQPTAQAAVFAATNIQAAVVNGRQPRIPATLSTEN
jgi:glycosyltransferase involved in cell wall biosynthesis